MEFKAFLTIPEEGNQIHVYGCYFPPSLVIVYLKLQISFASPEVEAEALIRRGAAVARHYKEKLSTARSVISHIVKFSVIKFKYGKMFRLVLT